MGNFGPIPEAKTSLIGQSRVRISKLLILLHFIQNAEVSTAVAVEMRMRGAGQNFESKSWPIVANWVPVGEMMNIEEKNIKID